MAGLAAILRALGRAVWRDLRSYHSLTGNNFFLFVLLLAQQPSSSAFFGLILALLLLFPLSADPLAKVPPERLDLWPLARSRRLALRIASIALSPAAWITIALVVKTRPALALGFLALALLIQALGALGARLLRRAPGLDLLRRIPAFPGHLGELARKDLRQVLRVLDFYMALLLGVAGAAYRLLAKTADPEAFPMLAVMVALALSTYAQCLFGLDGPDGWTRYHLEPLRGWQILLPKGVAFVLCATPLVAALDLLTGVSAALAALAIGQYASVHTPVPQQQWRFTGGTLFPTGLVQVVCMFGVGIGAHRSGALYLLIAVAAYAFSLWYCGRAWDRRRGQYHENP